MNTRGQMWLETVATAFEVVIAGALILFFINQGIMIAKGTSQPSRYYAEDIALTIETLAGLQAQKAVVSYSDEELKEFKIELGNELVVEKITGFEHAATRLVRVPELVYGRAVEKENLTVVKLANKVLLVPETVKLDQLVLGTGPVTRIQVIHKEGVVAYEAS